MRKKIAVMMGICMLAAAVIGGCGSDKAADGGNGAKQEAAGSKSAGGYVFESDGVEIAPDMDSAPIVEKLGEPDSYFEEPSCAAEGIAKLYTYGSFEIETYPDGDKDLVCTVVLKDDNVATAEGIDLSKTKADVIEAYGDDYEESGSSIVYEKGGMKLCFILDGDNIASIEYNSSVLD